MKHLITTIKHALQQITEAVEHAIDTVIDLAQRLWNHHLELMDEEPSYRAQIIAGANAVLTVLRLPRILTASLLAALGLHAAAYGLQPTPTRPRWTDDDGWDRFR